MKSPMTPDDPRLTAYALGELSPSERPEIEAALRDSAECRAAVSEIRQVAESLQVGLGAEPCPQLSPERKESVLRAVPAPEPSAHRSPSTPGWWMLWGPRLGWGVAGAAVASLVWLLQPSAPLAHLPSQQEQTAQPAETVPPAATTGLALATSQEPATNAVVPMTVQSNSIAVAPPTASPSAPSVLVVKSAPAVVIVRTNLSAPAMPSTPVVERAPEVLVVAGVESKALIDENWEVFQNGAMLTADEGKEIEAIRRAYDKAFCRRCDYCQPCSEKISIQAILGLRSMVKRMGKQILQGNQKEAIETARNCTGCKECTTRCPYQLPIPDLIRENLAWADEQLK